MSEWQPIATAPRDGTLMDQWTRRGRRITDVYWHKGELYQGWSNIRHSDQPTHWMPLPEPPK